LTGSTDPHVTVIFNSTEASLPVPMPTDIDTVPVPNNINNVPKPNNINKGQAPAPSQTASASGDPTQPTDELRSAHGVAPSWRRLRHPVGVCNSKFNR
jgi:hypothetical protein